MTFKQLVDDYCDRMGMSSQSLFVLAHGETHVGISRHQRFLNKDLIVDEQVMNYINSRQLHLFQEYPLD